MTIVGPAHEGPLGSQWARDVTDAVNALEAAFDSPAWVPSFGGVSGGAVAGEYQQVGRQVIGWATWTAGTVTGNTFLNLPVAMSASTPTYMPLGNVTLRDASAANFIGVITAEPVSVGRIRYNNISGSANIGSFMSAAAPFAWTAGDILLVQFSYLADA